MKNNFLNKILILIIITIKNFSNDKIYSNREITKTICINYDSLRYYSTKEAENEFITNLTNISKKENIIGLLTILKDKFKFFLSVNERKKLNNSIDKILEFLSKNISIDLKNNSIHLKNIISELELFKVETDYLKEYRLDISKNLNNHLSKIRASDNYYFFNNLNFINKIVIWTVISADINYIYSKYKDEKTLDFIFSLMIYPLFEKINEENFEKTGLNKFLESKNITLYEIKKELNTQYFDYKTLINSIEEKESLIRILLKDENLKKVNNVLEKIKKNDHEIKNFNFSSFEANYSDSMGVLQKGGILNKIGAFLESNNYSFYFMKILTAAMPIIAKNEKDISNKMAWSLGKDLTKSNYELILESLFGTVQYARNIYDFNKKYFDREKLFSKNANFINFNDMGFFKYKDFFIINNFTNTYYGAITAYSEYKYIKSVIHKFHAFHNYYNLLKEKIALTNELYNLLKILYKENNLSLPAEINFYSNKDYLSELNKEFSFYNKNYFKEAYLLLLASYSLIKDYVAGKNKKLICQFRDNKIINTLHNFIEFVNCAAEKASLIINSENENYKISIPKIKSLETLIENGNEFEAKNLWFSNILVKEPKMQNINLLKNSRNMLLVSPYAGGKTSFLSTYLINSYLCRAAICTAESIILTPSVYILNKMETSYEIGSGVSKHMQERNDIDELNNFIDDRLSINDKVNFSLIIDEIYNGTHPKDAVKEALDDTKNLLNNKFITNIYTTHFPELLELSSKNSFTKIFYLRVNKISENLFERTFTVYPSDDENWWLNNAFESTRDEYRKYVNKMKL